jgi:hypothetical protein
MTSVALGLLKRFQREKSMHGYRAALLLVALAAPAIGAPPVISASPLASPSASQPDAGRWADTLRRLAASDFAQREAAQKDLDQLGWHQLDFLRASANDVRDPEIKARLTARVTAIEEDLAVNPPPLNITLKNANLAEVAAALSNALGMQLDYVPTKAETLFTLRAENQPFWEIFTELSRQHGLVLHAGSRVRIECSDDEAWRKGVILGPVAVFPQPIGRRRASPPLRDSGQELLYLDYALAIDPRVHVVRSAGVQLTEITDDAGNLLAQQPIMRGVVDRSPMNTVQNVTTPLAIPAKLGSRIASAKGRISFSAQISEDRLEIPDLETKVGQTFHFAGISVALTPQIQPETKAIIDLRVDSDAKDRRVTLILLDSKNQIAVNDWVDGSYGQSFQARGPFTAPFKAVLSVPTRTKSVTIPFELKDLPLP